mmetsp:Transcript_33439/g.64054  ORF Transcript_33439/g.64054 Transcript_33439/m.64054 type:complete len:141 (-) Transcript_33439:240-662(-)
MNDEESAGAGPSVIRCVSPTRPQRASRKSQTLEMDDRTSWELRASVAMEKDEMATTQLESLDTNDKGWTYRLDQIDKDLAHAENEMEDFINDMEDLKTDLKVMQSPNTPQTLSGFEFSEAAEPDYTAVNRLLATQKAESG